MDLKEFLILIGIFLLFMAAYRLAGKAIKKFPAKTLKMINWIAFTTALLSGIAWYAFSDGIFMLITVAAVIVYFLFYDYDKPEETDGIKTV